MLLVIKGKVDDWRLQRKSAWKIAEAFRGSQQMPSEYDFYPLPFDREAIEKEKQEQDKDIAEWHKNASKQLANFRWPNKN